MVFPCFPPPKAPSHEVATGTTAPRYEIDGKRIFVGGHEGIVGSVRGGR
jgi:hypothetical protein